MFAIFSSPLDVVHPATAIYFFAIYVHQVDVFTYSATVNVRDLLSTRLISDHASKRPINGRGINAKAKCDVGPISFR